MAPLRRTLDAVTDGAAALSAGCVGLTALAYAAEVVARYFLNAPLNWSADFGSYMLCASVFLCLPRVTADAAHPSISFAVDRLAGPAHARYTRVLSALTAVVVAAVCWFIFEEAVRQYDQGVLTSAANQIPRWWLSATALFGLTMTVLHLVLARPALTLPVVPEP